MMGFFDFDSDDRSLCHIDFNNDGKKDYIDDCIFNVMNSAGLRSSYDDIEDDIEFMDEDERREYFEDNGIDPDDFD